MTTSRAPRRSLNGRVEAERSSQARVDQVAEALVAARPHAIDRALRLLRGDHAAAEDLVEDVISELWERGTHLGETYTVPYVMRCVQNAAIDRWRRARRQAAKLPLLPGPAGGSDLDVVGERLEIQRLLRLLPPVQREIVTLRYLADLTQEEVAAELGIPQGTVASAAWRAVRKLRQAQSSAA